MIAPLLLLIVTLVPQALFTGSEHAKAIVQTSANERAPSLVATPTGYLLFYLSDASGGFRIVRATSTAA